MNLQMDPPKKLGLSGTTRQTGVSRPGWDTGWFGLQTHCTQLTRQELSVTVQAGYWAEEPAS
jgi:hypothetical protein